MKELNYTPSDLIIAFYDGDLGQEGEDKLFGLLSKDPELRSEVKQHSYINSVISADSEMILPPPGSKEAFLSAAGLSDVPSHKGRGAAAPLLWLKNYSGYLFTAILASVITYMLFFSQGTQQGSELQSGKDVMNASVPVGSDWKYVPRNESGQSKKIPVTVPVVNASGEDNESNIEDEIVQVDLTEQGENGAEQIYIPANIEKSSMVLLSPVPNNPGIVDLNSAYNGHLINQVEIPEASGWGISFRGFTNWSFPSTDVSTNKEPFFSHMALGVQYESGEHIIGIEFGSEEFAQVYEGKDKNNGLGYRIEQNPNLYWGGVSYHYNVDNLRISENFSPYIRVLAGATEIGPIGRVSLGLEYKPGSKVTFLLGLEATSLMYFHDNKGWFSNKYGITYGFRVSY